MKLTTLQKATQVKVDEALEFAEYLDYSQVDALKTAKKELQRSAVFLRYSQLLYYFQYADKIVREQVELELD
jgi:hypothetical protein